MTSTKDIYYVWDISQHKYIVQNPPFTQTLHCVDKPCIIKERDGEEIEHTWYDNNKIHRIGAPAFISWFSNNNKSVRIHSEEWYFKGLLHRKDQPAEIEYWVNGKIKMKRWWKMGRRHREDGPIIQEWRIDGILKTEKWAIDNKILTENEWIGVMNHKKLAIMD